MRSNASVYLCTVIQQYSNSGLTSQQEQKIWPLLGRTNRGPKKTPLALELLNEQNYKTKNQSSKACKHQWRWQSGGTLGMASGHGRGGEEGEEVEKEGEEGPGLVAGNKDF